MRSSSKRTGRYDKRRTLTIRYLRQITSDDLKVLARYAERRTAWLPRAFSSGEDVVQKALALILLGTNIGFGGRRPKAASLQTKADFLRYVRSTINSVVEAAKRKREFWVIHETILVERDVEEGQTFFVIAAPVAADEDVAMVDLKNELFARLRQQAKPGLLPIINEWEKSFLWESSLPAGKKRSYTDRVRALAIRILRQIANHFAGRTRLAADISVDGCSALL